MASCVGLGGGGVCSSLPAAGSFVVGVPVLLLTLDGAVGGVPAAVVHGLLLAVVTLERHRGALCSDSAHTQQHIMFTVFYHINTLKLT